MAVPDLQPKAAWNSGRLVSARRKDDGDESKGSSTPAVRDSKSKVRTRRRAMSDFQDASARWAAPVPLGVAPVGNVTGGSRCRQRATARFATVADDAQVA